MKIIGDSGNSFGTSGDDGNENVTYPFTFKITYPIPIDCVTLTHNAIFEFTMNKPGEWFVTLGKPY